jgi:histidyl-tRNA synthetase
VSEIQNSIKDLGLDLLEDEDFLRMISTVEFLFKNGYEDIVYDPSTVRGLSYYTGIVFEGFDVDGKFRSIFGGGRYDNLSQLFEGQEIPAIGFGMGDAVLENLLKEKNLWKVDNEHSSYFLVGMGREGKIKAANLLYQLRRSGKTAVMENSERNISNSLKHASSMNFTHAIIIGEKELAERSLTIKNLINGEQKKIGENELEEL